MAEDKHLLNHTDLLSQKWRLHIGHAYTTVASLIFMIRYKETSEGWHLLNRNRWTRTKIQEKAKQAFLKLNSSIKLFFGIQDLWKKLDISYDDFIRTTQPRHTKAVQGTE